nr:MAG TPA: hypothetical protein [Caudoviricetes sp.]
MNYIFGNKNMFSSVSTTKLMEIYDDINISESKGLRARSLDTYLDKVKSHIYKKEPRNFDVMGFYRIIKDELYDEIAVRYFARIRIDVETEEYAARYIHVPVCDAFVPESIAWIRHHYNPVNTDYITCHEFGNMDGTVGVCYSCREIAPYQWEMCCDKQSLDWAIAHGADREQAIKDIEERKSGRCVEDANAIVDANDALFTADAKDF